MASKRRKLETTEIVTRKRRKRAEESERHHRQDMFNDDEGSSWLDEPSPEAAAAEAAAADAQAGAPGAPPASQEPIKFARPPPAPQPEDIQKGGKLPNSVVSCFLFFQNTLRRLDAIFSLSDCG
ncbi:hypothetical protein AAG570_004463 [Ranatra chinensis]|uniref:Uncharacterized protein n=1 Tax=Ranatra chinensis TaxID=642074 RepID=A0ABD0Y2E3_9HEMI